MDRVNGDVYWTLTSGVPPTRNFSLQCKPTQRMF
jgi:hypothetical protein